MKILVVRLSSIGDIVLATPLIRCLRNKFPDAQIDFILKEKYSEILSANPYISNLILFDGDFFKALKKIKSEKYNVIIDIHKNFKSFLLTFFSNAKVLKYKNHLVKKFLLVEMGINLYKEKISVSDMYLNSVESLGVSDDNKGLNFFIDEKINSKVGFLSEAYIGICPVSIWKTKRWLSESFIETARKILEKNNFEILIFGGKNDFEYCEHIKNQVGEKARNLCRISLQETAGFIKKCKFIITNDTSILHIAEALKVPVVAIFGPTVKEFGFYPQLNNSKVISKKCLCKPCTTKGSQRCPVGDFKCMKEISTEEVFTTCATYL
jgi:lipopolysaccharide heptosyltransferase II